MDDTTLANTLARIDARLARIEARMVADTSPASTSQVGPELREVKALERLAERLDKIEAGLQLLEPLPQVAATGMDAMDEAIGRLMSRGIDPDLRVKNLLNLLEQVSEPGVYGAITQLLERSEDLSEMVSLMETLPGSAAMAMDIIDEQVMTLQAQGLDLGSLRDGVLTLSRLASQLFGSEEFEAHAEGGFLSPRTFGIMGTLGESLQAAQDSPRQKPGILAILSALREPEVAAAVDFGLSFARHFGRSLSARPLSLPQ